MNIKSKKLNNNIAREMGFAPRYYKAIEDKETLVCNKCKVHLDTEISGKQVGDIHSCGGTLYHPRSFRKYL